MFGIRKDYLYFSIVILLAIIVSVACWRISNSIVYNVSVAIVGDHKDRTIGKKTLPINITSPKVLSKIKSPVFISGFAKGTWFFEASFPVKIIDIDGNILGQGPVTAKTDWMTEEDVAFEGTIPFQKGKATNGFVVFTPDDPSGLDRYEPVKVSVVFEEDKVKVSECVIGGCSSEICSDENMSSICIYREEFACYKSAKCERQQNGQCGWTETSELSQCIEDKRNTDSEVIY